MELLTAFTLGLFGSLHCVGMCGPIAMALPLTTHERQQVIMQSVVYNTGRICTYAFMGLFMGLLGWGILLAGYQKSISIILGVLLILSAIFSISLERNFLNNPGIQKALSILKKRMASLLSVKNNSGAFKLGILNGFLPCGMVYIALAGAVVSGSVLTGSLYMALFGLGTFPLMLGIMVFSQLKKKTLIRFRKWVPVIMVLFGIMLIFRGLLVDFGVK